jgi:predicted ATP-binding protein involved in virulence
MTKSIAPLVYLSYSSKETEEVEDIYNRLAEYGFKPWMLSEDVRPGENWEIATQKAIRSADYFIAFLSKNYLVSESKNREIELALEICKKTNDVFIIPARLEEVRPPQNLEQFKWVDLFSQDGFSKLLEALGKDQMFHLPQPTIPDSLVKACLSGDCILYAGAGIAASAGFPTWKPFVNQLIEWASANQIVNEDYKRSLLATANQNQLDTVADNIVNIAKENKAGNEFNLFLRKSFLEPRIELKEVHRTLREIPFSAVLTTNFDTLLEKIFLDRDPKVFTPQDTEALLDTFSKRDFFILKLYGDVDKSETVLISRTEFQDAVIRNVSFGQFMESLFHNRTILFMGTSISGIETYLEAIRFKGERGNHFALVEVFNDTYEVDANRLLRRYGIQIIPYTTNGDYIEVSTFVEELKRKVQKGQKKSRGSLEVGNASRKSWLKRIKLENIGPFETLSMDLNESWNILLGDNGVGKSSILKAIAIGIAGEDAQNYADRLIKSGNTHATITLETSTGNTYITEILKSSSGPAKVVSRTGRLLEGEGWLALGFPPLRSMSWTQLRGPQLEEGKKRPVPTDVLPLVTGDPDPRVDQLKQWILNLDYRSAKGLETGETEARSYQLMINEFFKVIQRLTEGVNVQFKAVDLNKGRIMIQTDDGEVPIESASQGTISLIGWVGILLQRLYEVFESSRNLEDQYALVMIDELDAHMHPEWQSDLVDKLSEIFPRVQFLATTHSPLIVSGLPGNQVFRFLRDEEGNIIQLEVKDEMTMGRADQVLTSSLFGLRTTLDRLTLDKVEEYQKLLGRKNRSPEEDVEFQSLQRTLAFRIPGPEETPVERQVQELLTALLHEQVGGQYPGYQKELLKKAETLFDEIKARKGDTR